MVKIEKNLNKNDCENLSCLLNKKRHLTANEIVVLEANKNRNSNGNWDDFYVDENAFDPSLIEYSSFSGFIILGRLEKQNLHYNDLVLECGIKNSTLHDVVLGDDCAIHNVQYMYNYRIGDRNILFNIQEIFCTSHSKFGNGFLKQGEEEEHRVWLDIGNENGGRQVLAFESMIPADAYIWSHYRDDKVLLERFKEITENKNNKKRDTFGIIENDCVIKNSSIIKDSKICTATYIKGALKLKNITILSSEEEPSQIGEGVEMVNGILGYGSKVFYQAIAVRFVIGRNCQVKYGARILNSVLGDNSTISCCEVLNNLIFPFHEQHHNSSFLIATTVGGQSNIASGATIGSNHNSRSPDGEIFAKRGFWPGLCSDFKHNSRFASFVLISKGSYQFELDIQYPFSLVAPCSCENRKIIIIPAWWFLYDMFAISRNNDKFIQRDKRKVKIQNIETDPLAPDTMQEVQKSLIRIIELTAKYLKETQNECMNVNLSEKEEFQKAKDFLHKNPSADFFLEDKIAQKKYGAVIHKPARAYKMYRKISKYYATRTLMEYCQKQNDEFIEQDILNEIYKIPLFTSWENVGGQIIPTEKIQQLFERIKNNEINSWDEIHEFYNECNNHYNEYKARYAIYILEQLYSRKIKEFTTEVYKDIKTDVSAVSNEIYQATVKSREKDYEDYYRTMVYRNKEEMDCVIGTIDNNSFIKKLKKSTVEFEKNINELFKHIAGGGNL